MSSYKHDCKGPFDSCKLSVKDFFYNFACDGEKKTVHELFMDKNFIIFCYTVFMKALLL